MKIAFLKGTNIFDWAIRLYSGGPFSHCEIVFSDGTWFSSRPSQNGVVYSHRGDDGQWVYIDIPASPEAEEKLRKWADGEIGCKYDWWGILWFLFRRVRPHPDKWFCSEICTAALQQLGYLNNIESYRVTPTELYKLCGMLKLSR